jgi:hypothetical protein
LTLGFLILVTLLLLAVEPASLSQPPPFPNRFYMVTWGFYLLLVPWLGLLVLNLYYLRKGGRSSTLLIIYLCIVTVVEIYWTLHTPFATHWDGIAHLGTSLFLQKRAFLPHEILPGYEYLDFPMFFLSLLPLLQLDLPPLAVVRIISVLLTILAYLLIFLILSRLFKSSPLFGFIASLLFLFVNLVLSGSNYASPFLLANVLFFAFLLSYLTKGNPVGRATLILMFLGAIALTNITMGYLLSVVVLVGSAATRSLRLVFLPTVALAWIIYGTIWFQVSLVNMAIRNLELLQRGEFIVTLASMSGTGIGKVEVPLWATTARFVWILPVVLTALWFIAKKYFHRKGLKAILDSSSVHSEEGLLLLLFFVPMGASLVAILVTTQGVLFERFLALSSLPAVYFATRHLQSVKMNARLVACLLVLWAGLFFFVREPFLYYRIVHLWDAAGTQFVSERQMTVWAFFGSSVSSKKLYDESYFRPISLNEKLTTDNLAMLYPDRFIYIPESLDVFGYRWRVKGRELLEENSPFPVVYNNGHNVIAYTASKDGAIR